MGPGSRLLGRDDSRGYASACAASSASAIAGRREGTSSRPRPGPTSSKDELSRVAQGIIDSLSRPYTINGTAVSIGASVGIVTSDYDDRTADDLMRDADLALYAAKAAGKGCFRFFAPEMHEAARERQLMESDLRVALEKEQLKLVYQPSVDATSEAVTGFEALIRWHHPEHGLVSPAAFIPLAEEIGLIDEIGEWVLRTACEEAAKWPEVCRSRSICRRCSSSRTRFAHRHPDDPARKPDCRPAGWSSRLPKACSLATTATCTR